MNRSVAFMGASGFIHVFGLIHMNLYCHAPCCILCSLIVKHKVSMNSYGDVEKLTFGCSTGI
jgi:hypothetical protein